MARSSTKTRHYAARPDADPVDLAAGGAGPVWRDALEGRYLSDVDAIAAVLPPPLEVTDDPTGRVAIATGTNPDGSSFGEGRVTVQARHGSVVGEYPLLVVVDTEQALFEARERFGDPARRGVITGSINDRRIEKRISRNDQHVVHLVGVVEGPEAPTPATRTEFTFRTRRALDGAMALAEDPELVIVTRTIEERRAATVGGIVRLGGTPFDPIRELPIRKTHGLRIAQQFVTVSARSAGSVPAASHEPFLHHRYDPSPVADRSD